MAKYVNFTKTAEHNLLITLLSYMRQDVEEFYERDDWDSDDRMQELISYQLENGWSWVTPYAGLTDAQVISDEVDFDDHGEVLHIGRMYWYMEYEKFDPVRELLNDGSILLLGAGNYETTEWWRSTESGNNQTRT